MRRCFYGFPVAGSASLVPAPSAESAGGGGAGEEAEMTGSKAPETDAVADADGGASLTEDSSVKVCESVGEAAEDGREEADQDARVGHSGMSGEPSGESSAESGELPKEQKPRKGRFQALLGVIRSMQSTLQGLGNVGLPVDPAFLKVNLPVVLHGPDTSASPDSSPTEDRNVTWDPTPGNTDKPSHQPSSRIDQFEGNNFQPSMRRTVYQDQPRMQQEPRGNAQRHTVASIDHAPLQGWELSNPSSPEWDGNRGEAGAAERRSSAMVVLQAGDPGDRLSGEYSEDWDRSAGPNYRNSSVYQTSGVGHGDMRAPYGSSGPYTEIPGSPTSSPKMSASPSSPSRRQGSAGPLRPSSSHSPGSHHRPPIAPGLGNGRPASGVRPALGSPLGAELQLHPPPMSMATTVHHNARHESFGSYIQENSRIGVELAAAHQHAARAMVKVVKLKRDQVHEIKEVSTQTGAGYAAGVTKLHIPALPQAAGQLSGRKVPSRVGAQMSGRKKR
ncbi:hypothetical protein CYMTET_20965 [Cymbomonas tetramitiformis]|uniref:Uncharacterized protein n=1 Tax=Cymbomonas tetramitiformis TaxID=36881 RepID=A0AAE0G3Q9_9CHLO|nr:hypothetical protein CYMTET_20965 [Cymbomonas tetramitiformis]